MLEDVALADRRFDAFRDVLEPALYDEVRDLGKRLQGLRVLQVNATAHGGGVAELLRQGIPLLRGLGLRADWQVLKAPMAFYETTKRLHDGLQGSPEPLPATAWDGYEAVCRNAARDLDPDAWDVIVIHDPQPCAMRRFVKAGGRTRWVWRCHIDSSRPQAGIAQRISGYVGDYDAAVYTLPQFALDGGGPPQSFIFPGIDPHTAKNVAIERDRAESIVAEFGVDPTRPLATQVSRFDRWKDPVGVVEAFRAAKQQVPDLQLVLAGQSADDDPDGARILAEVRNAAEGVADVHLLADRADDLQVNALQMASTVVLQKSLREGFGLTVSEALWAGTPVIGGNVGGIPSQVREGETGFLVDNVAGTGQRLAELAGDPARARAMGTAGQEDVRHRFLLPRMLRDEMRLWQGLVA